MGFALAGLTDPDTAHFPITDSLVMVTYAIVAAIGAAVIALLSLRVGLPTGFRRAAGLAVFLGVVLIIAFGGLIVWVAPLLLIAADVYATSATRLPALPVIAAVLVAVTVALTYGLFRPEAPSGWLGAGLLWPLPLAYLLLQRRRRHGGTDST